MTAELLVRAWQSGATGDEQRELCPVCAPGVTARSAQGPSLREVEERAAEQATALVIDEVFSAAFRMSPRQEAVALARSAGQSKADLERAIERYRVKVRRETEELVQALVAAAASVAMTRAARAAQSPRLVAEVAGWGHGLSVDEREEMVLAERGLDPSLARTTARAAVGDVVHPDQVWLTVRQVATITGVSAATVRSRARVEAGDTAVALHGHRDDASVTSRWSIRRDVVEAWMQQKDLHDQIELCGCRRRVSGNATGRRS